MCKMGYPLLFLEFFHFTQFFHFTHFTKSHDRYIILQLIILNSEVVIYDYFFFIFYNA